MKPDLNLIDSLRRLIDFAGLSGNSACQVVLASLLEDLAKAVEHEKPLPANMADAPSGRPMMNPPDGSGAGYSNTPRSLTQLATGASVDACWRGNAPPRAFLRLG